jgi:hypothetical protein
MRIKGPCLSESSVKATTDTLHTIAPMHAQEILHSAALSRLLPPIGRRFFFSHVFASYVTWSIGAAQTCVPRTPSSTPTEYRRAAELSVPWHRSSPKTV